MYHNFSGDTKWMQHPVTCFWAGSSQDSDTDKTIELFHLIMFIIKNQHGFRFVMMLVVDRNYLKHP